MVSSDITLRDGRAVHLRATRPADEAELLQAFERMSEEARYMRLMHVVREPNLERCAACSPRFPRTESGSWRRSRQPMGSTSSAAPSRCSQATRTSCEFAITVDAAYGGTGLGTTLMTALIDEARSRGRKEMEGFVLSENKSMLRLAKRLGFSIKYAPDDTSVRICRLALDKP